MTISVQAPAAPATLTNIATATATNGAGGGATARAVVLVGNGGQPLDVPALDRRALALLAALVVWTAVRVLRRGA